MIRLSVRVKTTTMFYFLDVLIPSAIFAQAGITPYSIITYSVSTSQAATVPAIIVKRAHSTHLSLFVFPSFLLAHRSLYPQRTFPPLSENA